METFFNILSYFGGILSAVSFISAAIIFFIVRRDIMKDQETETIHYNWDDLE